MKLTRNKRSESSLMVCGRKENITRDRSSKIVAEYAETQLWFYTLFSGVSSEVISFFTSAGESFSS
jgi:hypothetical protein